MKFIETALILPKESFIIINNKSPTGYNTFIGRRALCKDYGCSNVKF